MGKSRKERPLKPGSIFYHIKFAQGNAIVEKVKLEYVLGTGRTWIYRPTVNPVTSLDIATMIGSKTYCINKIRHDFPGYSSKIRIIE